MPAWRAVPDRVSRIHPRHRRSAVNVGVMVSLLLKNAEYAGLGGMTRHSARNLRARNKCHTPVDVDLLLIERDDKRCGLAERIGRCLSHRLCFLFHVDYRQNEGALKHGNEGWREVAQHRWNGVTQHCDRGFLRAVPNFT